MDLATKRVTTVAGNGQKGYTGDGGPAVNATLSAPHELVFDRKGDLYFAERDNNVIRKVDMKTGIVSTAAGTGVAGYSGDGGPSTKSKERRASFRPPREPVSRGTAPRGAPPQRLNCASRTV